MHILVTGAAGYLGGTLARVLLERGHTLRLFDRFCFGREALAEFENDSRCEIVAGDIRRLQEQPRLLEGIEAIVHLASLANDPSCDLDPDMAADVNIESTRELAGLAVRLGIRRFVLGSSCGVYGRGAFEWLDEDSPPNPVSTFARTKLEGERIVLGLAGDHFEPVVARVATMYGVSPRMRFDLAVNQMVATAMRQGSIKIMGGGGQWRPFVHVRDAARAFALMLEADPASVAGRIFNVGDDAANVRIADLAARVAAAFDNVSIETPKDDDELRTYRVLFGRIRETLDFACERTIEDGIAEVRTFMADTGADPFDERFFNAWRMKTLLATPVDEGGEPVAARFIPLARPVLNHEEEEIVVEAIRSLSLIHI